LKNNREEETKIFYNWNFSKIVQILFQFIISHCEKVNPIVLIIFFYSSLKNVLGLKSPRVVNKLPLFGNQGEVFKY